MGGPVCNTTLEESHIHEDPIFHNLTFHELGLIITAAFGLFATAVSSWLIFMHATHYSKPSEQKHIMRILFLIPIYSVVSFLCFMFYRHFIYFQVVMECYEAFAIASFFTLLCHYIAPTLHDQKDFFRSSKPRDWIWPISWLRKCCPSIWKTPRSGLTLFNMIWLGVFQYCFVRVFMTTVSMITQATGRYCEASLHPAFAHVWVMVTEATSVTVAMYCLIQFYLQVKEEIAPHRPLLKVICIKLVIFFSFWQSLAISALTSSGVLSPGARINYADYKIGIPQMLLVVEMAFFAILHIFAFSYREYVRSKASKIYAGAGVGAGLSGSDEYRGGFLGIKAYLDAYNPWDIIKAIGRGFRWMFVGFWQRTTDPSYQSQHPHHLPLSHHHHHRDPQGGQVQQPQGYQGHYQASSPPARFTPSFPSSSSAVVAPLGAARALAGDALPMHAVPAQQQQQHHHQYQQPQQYQHPHSHQHQQHYYRNTSDSSSGDASATLLQNQAPVPTSPRRRSGSDSSEQSSDQDSNNAAVAPLSFPAPPKYAVNERPGYQPR